MDRGGRGNGEKGVWPEGWKVERKSSGADGQRADL